MAEDGGSASPDTQAADAVAVFRHAGHGLTLELAPLTRPQAAAFLIGRGLSAADAELAAERGCFFRSALGNAGSTPGAPHVTIDLSQWRVTPENAASHAPGSRQDWDAFWRPRNLAEAPAVAFYWALFPQQQEFAPTDHNWGFITFMLAPGTTFALDVAWRLGDTPHRHRFERLRCAP